MFGRYQGLWSEVATKMRDVKGYPVKLSFGLGVGGPQCQSTQQTQAAAAGPLSRPSLGDALGGALGGMFGKKKAPPTEAAAPPAALPGGLDVTDGHEHSSWSAVNADARRSAIVRLPAGYKKVAAD